MIKKITKALFIIAIMLALPAPNRTKAMEATATMETADLNNTTSENNCFQKFAENSCLVKNLPNNLSTLIYFYCSILGTKIADPIKLISDIKLPILTLVVLISYSPYSYTHSLSLVLGPVIAKMVVTEVIGFWPYMWYIASACAALYGVVAYLSGQSWLHIFSSMYFGVEAIWNSNYSITSYIYNNHHTSDKAMYNAYNTDEHYRQNENHTLSLIRAAFPIVYLLSEIPIAKAATKTATEAATEVATKAATNMRNSLAVVGAVLSTGVVAGSLIYSTKNAKHDVATNIKQEGTEEGTDSHYLVPAVTIGTIAIIGAASIYSYMVANKKTKQQKAILAS